MTIKSTFDQYSYIKLHKNITFKLTDDTFIMLLLTALYDRHIITREKLVGQLRSLRNGNLSSYKQTYHCTINNQWYSDETGRAIFEDLMDEYNLQVVNINKLIEVLQIYTNESYNKCIDFIIDKVYRPFHDGFVYSVYDHFEDYIITAIDDFPEIRKIYDSNQCYECGHDHKTINYRASELEFNTIVQFFNKFKK